MDRRKEETTADTAMDLGHIVVTRLMPFAQHTQLLQRPQLLTRLDWLDASLILVQAPAGYGKTTLLAQWRERLLAAGEQVAWVSLDEEDDNPATLVSYLSCALHQAGLDLAPALYTTLAGDENEAKHRLRRLLNAIAASGRRIVLILDEFERVPPTVAGMVFPFLVAMAPPNLVLAIASRELPAALPLATLRARGMAVELRADDLHFSDHEIGALFDGRLSRKDLCAVVEKTNGWPVALQLLRGWWQRKGQSPQEIALLDQATPDIAEYLSEQILAALPPAQRTFLAEASVLDRLSAGALEQVVGSSDGWRDILAADALRRWNSRTCPPNAGGR
jgi:LuxR family maltose regulon positive regulatory protein